MYVKSILNGNKGRTISKSDWDYRRCYDTYTSHLWTIQSLLLPSFFLGGNTSIDNNPKHDGDDGTSFLSPEGQPFLYPLKGNVKGF